MGRLRFAIFCILFVICCASSHEATDKPHIIVILADDVGWNDFGFHGSSQIPTPNIDALGYNGVFLNNFYTQAICTPSRAAFLSGKYPIRFGFQGFPIYTGEDRPMPHDVVLLPERLKELGYKNHMVGKWHLSAARKNDTPIGRGFDSYFGYYNGLTGYFDYTSYYVGRGETYKGFDLHYGLAPQWDYYGQYATDVFTEKSLNVIDNHNTSEPLFLYLAHLAGHTGGQNGDELGVKNITQVEETYAYINDSMRQKYADVVNQMDKSVGEVVNKLKQRGMLENSVIVFLSDNGAPTSGHMANQGSNWPLKGIKQTLLEGGVRGSAIVFSNLLSKKGYINNNLMHITDLYTTLVHVAGGDVDSLDELDGINQWDTISENTATSRTEILLNVDERQAFSGILTDSGRWKYLNGSFDGGMFDGAQGDSGRDSGVPYYDINAVLNSDVNQALGGLDGITPLTPGVITNLREALDISSCNGKVRTSDPACIGECLFDLWDDPCETNNIVTEEKDIAASLKAKLEEYVKVTVPQPNSAFDINSNPANCNGTWYTWLDPDGCVE